MALDPPPDATPTSRLLGRDRELDALAAVAGPERGPGAVLVVGEPGTGKSALLDEVAHRARRTGVRVLRAAGSEFEAGVGYAGLHQLLLPVSDRLDELPEAHTQALAAALGLRRGDPPDRLLLTSATLALLGRVATGAGLLVVVDDLQWLDRASQQVLALASRRLGPQPVTLLLAQRSGHDTFVDRAALPTVRLGPLDDESAVALLRARHPQLHASVRQRVVEEAGGNPLALIELPRGLTAAQEVAGEPLPQTLPLGDRLRELFTERLTALPAPTRRLLLLAALDGADGSELMTVVAGSAVDLAPAEEAGLVTVDQRSHRLRFSHPLVRAATVDLATAPQRRAAHRRLAQLSEDPGVRALHLAESALGTDDEVAERLTGVARSALDRGDGVRAVSVLLRAAELSSRPAERAERLAAAAFVGANVTGALAGARALLERARAADPDVTGTLQASAAAAAELLNSDGDIDTAHRVLVASLDQATSDTAEPAAVASAVHTLMLVCTFGGRRELWEAFDSAVDRFSAVLPAPLRVAAVTFADPLRSTPALLAELDDLVEDLDGDANHQRVLQVGIAGNYVDRFPQRALQRVVDDARSGGVLALGAQALVLLAVQAFFEGRWGDAATLSDEAVGVCEENGYELLLWGALNPRMLLAAARADTAYLDRTRGRMRSWALPRRAFAVRTFTANVDGLAALTDGRHQDAYDAYTSIAAPGSFPPHEQVTSWTVVDVVEAAVRSGHVDEARAHVAEAFAQGLPGVSDRLRLACAGAAALVADDGTYDEAFHAVLGDEASARWPFHLARLELAYGERLRRDRQMRRARSQLERAVDRFSDLGAEPWAERARAALRATGRTRRHRDDGDDAAPTPQELEVARLAASGLSNREIGERLFLSPRTVGAHLYRVFPKLGVTARAGLRDALTRHGH